MTIYVVPDIHGEYEKLITIMSKIEQAPLIKSL